jgi:hypothetical protein
MAVQDPVRDIVIRILLMDISVVACGHRGAASMNQA